jgi:hypothetical protein
MIGRRMSGHAQGYPAAGDAEPGIHSAFEYNVDGEF